MTARANEDRQAIESVGDQFSFDSFVAGGEFLPLILCT